MSLKEHILQVLHCAATQKYNTVAHKVCDAAEKVQNSDSAVAHTRTSHTLYINYIKNTMTIYTHEG